MTTLLVSPVANGDALIVSVWALSSTATVSSVSGGGVTTWIRLDQDRTARLGVDAIRTADEVLKGTPNMFVWLELAIRTQAGPREAPQAAHRSLTGRPRTGR